MFKKVLIANRGEIALRVIRACRELGIEDRGRLREADRESLHVRLADDDVCIGPPPSRGLVPQDPATSSRPPRSPAPTPSIPATASCRRTPNSPRSAGRRGSPSSAPPPSRSGRWATRPRRGGWPEAGVPTVPGSPGPIEDAGRGAGVAEAIGFPVIIKATAGGGGKGMRVAQEAEQFAQLFGLAQNEALAAFGNGGRLPGEVHRASAPRRDPGHGRQLGNVVHLGERDCSVQRRHQKLIEESPSPALTPELRDQHGRRPRWRSPPTSATSAPARSSSCWTPTAASTSWR